MFLQSSLLHTISHSVERSPEELYIKNGRVAQASHRRKRALSTSSPLKTLSFNSEYLSLESLFNYLPATPRRFSWQPPASPAPILKPTPSRTTITSLPTELVCLIFDAYMTPTSADTQPDTDAYPNGFLSASCDFVRTPIPLTHVCRRWRQTAIAHRRLWSNIALAFADGAQEIDAAKARGKLQLLRLFLMRSRDSPLSISFSASTGQSDLVREALQHICRYAHLWKELRLELDRASGMEALLDQIVTVASRGSTFPLLEKLHLDLVLDDDECEYENAEEEEAMWQLRLMEIKNIYNIILRRSANLTDITLDHHFLVGAAIEGYSLSEGYAPRCAEDGDDTMSLVPWTNLKNIAINCDSITTSDVLDICSRASNLETLQAWRVEFDQYDCVPPAPSSIALPRLHTLNATLLAHPEHLLSALSLPSLTNLDVKIQSLSGRVPVHGETASLEAILAPINQLVDASRPLAPIDVSCRLSARCVDGSAPLAVDASWMQAKGLNALAAASSRSARSVVEISKW